MSLNKVTKIFNKPLILFKSRIGYMILKLSQCDKNVFLISPGTEYWVKIGELCRFPTYPDRMGHGDKSYIAGFAIIRILENARYHYKWMDKRSFAIFKVEYNEITALGFQVPTFASVRLSGNKIGAVVVARTCRILEKVRSI